MSELFPRLKRLPEYIFAEINSAKARLRKAGEDIVDLGMGNPDVPAPPSVVEKVRETIINPKNHRYSMSKGLPKLREAICKRYKDIYGVELDPENESVTVLGTKEGIFQLVLSMATPGDVILIPSPTYPLHLYSGVIAGAHVKTIPLLDGNFLEDLKVAYRSTWPRPKALIISFPHNPTTMCVDKDFLEELVNFAHKTGIKIIHDFAYADITFDGYKAPSILEIDGAKEIAVEFYSMSKSFSMAGFRVGFALGNEEMIWAISKIKSYMDYGMFQPIQIASIIALRDEVDHPKHVAEVYRRRRDVLCEGLKRLGWDITPPKGTMFVWAKIPFKVDSMKFAKILLEAGKVAVSPGVGFGQGGEGYIRFALVENEHRIRQAIQGIKKVMKIYPEICSMP